MEFDFAIEKRRAEDFLPSLTDTPILRNRKNFLVYDSASVCR